MPQVVSQVQIKRSDKTLNNLSTTKLKYGEPILLVNSANKALVIGNSSETDTIANDYFIPLGTKDTLDKGYMVKGIDYVTAGQKSGETLGTKATAEGNNTVAKGSASHAEGTNTTASHKSQHVFGEYNVVDTSSAAATSRGTYVEIVGNGTAANALSNARTLEWNGNETLAGKLTLGAGPTNNLDAATKEYVDDAIPANAVTSVRVRATSPVVSSQNTEQSSTLDTTISLANGYGDTKNPYTSKTKNYILAAPSDENGVPSFRALVADDIPNNYGDTKNPYASKAKNLVLATPASAAGVPSFRALVANDIPTLTKSKISDFPTSMTPTAHNHAAGDINSGTLGVARGGTGATTFTSGYALIGNGTNAITTRGITNITSTSTAIQANTNLTTVNTLRYIINRTTSVAAADTGYGTYMARGEALFNTDTNPTLNGTISWKYE